jgi:hypothetical protein
VALVTILAVAIGHYLAAHAVVAVVVAIAALTLAGLAEWFQQREGLLEKNKDALAFTIGEMINNKKYVEIPGLFGNRTGSNRIIQGIYDQKSGKILDMRGIVTDSVAPEIVRAHAQENLAIYTR